MRGGGVLRHLWPTPACAGITRSTRSRPFTGPAYPRVRGDHSIAVVVMPHEQGLPPRARGSRADHLRRPRRAGPTPACAGITSASGWFRRPTPAYPRVRGDHRFDSLLPVGSAGLPPRARGSLGGDLEREGAGGPTPACAGITGDSVTGQVSTAGLPPRARGSQRLRIAAPGMRGPTPACAGITRSSRARRPATPAYPRVRGDHCCSPTTCGCAGGLPPRARGSQARDRDGARPRGPTPACAGITLLRRAWEIFNAAYPRVRGDHRAARTGSRPGGGLPPRARGSPSAAERFSSWGRPTPACAGITSYGRHGAPPPSAYPRVRGDHVRGLACHVSVPAYPRVRGDHGRVVGSEALNDGLPPRARGSPRIGPCGRPPRRPTPACAGIT